MCGHGTHGFVRCVVKVHLYFSNVWIWNRVNFTKSSFTSLTMQQQEDNYNLSKLVKNINLEKVSTYLNSPIRFPISANLACRLQSSRLNFKLWLFRLFKSHISFSLFTFKSSPCLRQIPNRCVCLSGQVYWHSTLHRLIYRTWPAKTTRAVWWAICVHSHRDWSNLR